MTPTIHCLNTSFLHNDTIYFAELTREEIGRPWVLRIHTSDPAYDTLHEETLCVNTDLALARTATIWATIKERV